jgi:hypothetical protein
MKNKYNIEVIEISAYNLSRDKQLEYRNNLVNNNFIQHYSFIRGFNTKTIDYSRIVSKNNDTYIFFGIDINKIYK